MLIRFGFEISIACNAPVPMLLALSTHSQFAGRLIGVDRVRTVPEIPTEEYLDVYGNRITRIVAPAGELTLWSDCVAEVDGVADPVVPQARQFAVEELPSPTLTFLTASRYCESDELSGIAWQLFGGTQPGWPRVQAICDFVHEHATFGYQFGRPTKSAHDVYQERTGVCRDFAHLAVALCRAMNIPARYASGYLGDIGVPPSGPGDFCAWFEVFLEGQWYTFDARYNIPRIGRILMVRGSDAADVAMMTSFGDYALTGFRIWADEIAGQACDADILASLETRPDAAALIGPSSGRLAHGQSLFGETPMAADDLSPTEAVSSRILESVG